MKKFLVTLVLLTLLLVSCESVYRAIADPNSGVSRVVDKVERIVVVAKEHQAAAGPYGWIVGAVSSAVIAAVGIYKTHQKNVEIDAVTGDYLNEKVAYDNIARTAAAVVAVIEEVSKIPTGPDTTETIGAVVKKKVAEKLKNEDFYTAGKAIISELKK